MSVRTEPRAGGPWRRPSPVGRGVAEFLSCRVTRTVDRRYSLQASRGRAVKGVGGPGGRSGAQHGVRVVRG